MRDRETTKSEGDNVEGGTSGLGPSIHRCKYFVE